MEFLAIGFLVYATMSREAVSLSTTQRLVVLIFGVTAFGTMHQSAEFNLFAFFDQEGQGVPRYLGLGTALTLGLTGAAVIWLTLRARKKPRRHEVSILASATSERSVPQRCGHSQHEVIGSRLTDRNSETIPLTTRGIRPHNHPGTRKSRCVRLSLRAARQPDGVALGIWNLETEVAQPMASASRALTSSATRSNRSGSASREAITGRLGGDGYPERERHGADGSGNLGIGDAVADAKAGKPVRL